MKKIFLILVLGVILVSFASALSLCIDHTSPSAPSNFTLSNSGFNINLVWGAATDEPSCSGIDHYEIYRSYNSGNFSFLANSTTLSYANHVEAYGNYSYIVHARDLVSHQDGNGIFNSILIRASSNGGGGSSGGGGGGTSSSLFQCLDWQPCENGFQSRTCFDINGISNNVTETRLCVSELSASVGNNTNVSDLGLNTGTNTTTNNPTITGSIIRGVGGFVGSAQVSISMGILVILGSIFFVFKRRKNKKV